MWRFFKALAQLTANTEAMAASMAEANQRFRSNVLGDAPPECLEGPQTHAEGNGEAKGKNGRQKTVAGR